MKIDYDKYPIIRLLKQGDKNAVYKTKYPLTHTDYVNKNIKTFEEVYGLLIKDFNSFKLFFVSSTVVDAFDTEHADEKLWELRDEVQDVLGVMLLGNGNYYVYTIAKHKEKGCVSVNVFEYNKDILCGSTLGGYFLDNNTFTDNNGNTENMYASDSMTFHASNKSPSDLIRLVVTFEIFKQFAEIETKILNNTCKKTKLANCIYENAIDKAVTIIDSTWYTNLVKSEGFGVRGHFRLQPFGEERKQRKLIWINDFQKNGYVREAKKQKQSISF